MIQHPLELLMIQSDKPAYLTDLSCGGAESFPLFQKLCGHIRDVFHNDRKIHYDPLVGSFDSDKKRQDNASGRDQDIRILILMIPQLISFAVVLSYLEIRAPFLLIRLLLVISTCLPSTNPCGFT